MDAPVQGAVTGAAASPPAARPDAAAAVEAAVLFGLIVAQIWFFQDRAPGLAALLLGLVIASWTWRRDTLKSLGLQPEDFSQAANIGLALAVALTALAAVAHFKNPGFTHRLGSLSDHAKKVMEYYGWALFQQMLLHGYFTNRFHRATGTPWPAALLSGLLFGLVHVPNWKLSAACLAGGAAGAVFFLKSRNLYPIALAHAVLAVCLRSFLHISMRVGPGF